VKNEAPVRSRVSSASRTGGPFLRGPRGRTAAAAKAILRRAPILACALALIASLHPGRAHAQVFAQLGPGAVLKKDVRLGAFGLAGDHQVGGLGEARFLLTLGMDLGIQVGARHFSDVDFGETVIDAGFDLRYGLVKESEDVPFDLLVGAGLGVTSGDHLTVITTAVFTGASKTLSTSMGREITPYAGLVMTIAHTKVDLPGSDDGFSDPDVDVSLRLGLTAALKGDAFVTGELQIKEESTVYLGLGTSF
jgi:hypothetical protein